MEDNSSSSSPSPLDKPLAQLTEDDIAQLTREDCRRFLKLKGMRRPSWNKSQAIQQVISLKALIEGRPGSGDSPAGPEILTKPQKSSPVADAVPSTEHSLPVVGHLAEETQLPAQKEACPYRRRDPAPPLFSAGETRVPVVGRDSQMMEKNSYSNRVAAAVPVGQMTIFYDGKINVYECVMAEQARMIMEVAGSSGQSGDEIQPPVSQFHPPLASTIGRPNHGTVDGHDDGRLPWANGIEGPTTRKASVRRYLEKRKDRFKGKRVIAGSAPSSLDMLYLSQKIRCQNPNEPVSGAEKSSILPQPPGTPARSNSSEKLNQNIRLSIDLNYDGGGIDEPS